MIGRALFITGIPGVGKTTLAVALAEWFHRDLLTMHDLVEQGDPESLARGDMADEFVTRRLFMDRMVRLAGKEFICDGWPRTQAQALLMPDDAQMLFMTCRIDIARDRLLRRGRADDTPELVEKRIREQSALLAVDEMDGWSFERAGYENCINVSLRSADSTFISVFKYLSGQKGQAYDG